MTRADQRLWLCLDPMHGAIAASVCLHCVATRLRELEKKVEELETRLGCPACVGRCSETLTRHTCGAVNP